MTRFLIPRVANCANGAVTVPRYTMPRVARCSSGGRP
jgi:hypothetical protein